MSINSQADLLPYDLKFEFPRKQLKLGRRLGSGALGIVVKGEASGLNRENTVTTVAVKMVKRSADLKSIRNHAKELEIMIFLGNHPNIVNLLGACTKNIFKCELLVIVEYCRHGNLRDHLFRNRSSFLNQIDSETGKFDFSIKKKDLQDNDENRCALQPSTSTKNIKSDKHKRCKITSSENMVYWTYQIARGMDFLSKKRVLHGDLAARNILLADDNIVKICDFGLAKSLYNESKYKKCDGLVPVKWMAIECFREQTFSTKSDVWSFGIVMWELFTLTNTPYPGINAEDCFIKLCEGYRLEKPQYATDRVYELMFQCWRENPEMRPTFTMLVESIGFLMNGNLKLRGTQPDVHEQY